ncbi:MAG: RdgB/HAM1 family non-canonical purine NTP pyrophosphatase [Cyclobacteriaceae bacterium]|jgi:XTP/dITP diphosphohydrolase|nr:non-canonical purine NTP pyrophosphatase, RdgB/HAM1 family [Cytophagales bacterium]HNP76684.1 RdgB/HAM1 family non-canonical purine NTP pyrophosphatase [Cyclobacteriaceae bacterium]
MKSLCFATNNMHKLEEVRAALGETFRIVTLAEIGCTIDLPETQPTIEGNALQKARYVRDHFHVSCFADDTGLEVDALQGAPGVYSARYAGPQRNSDDNIDLLLRNLDTSRNRSARFKTVIALVNGGEEHLFEGVLEGNILRKRQGNGGFGYDPVFQPIGQTISLAELSMDQKNQISHRGMAVRKLVNFLRAR